MASNSQRLLSHPGALFQGNAFYPHGSSITFSEPLLGPTLLYAPIYWISGNPYLAYNLTELLLWGLSGIAMALLAWEVTGSIPAALVGAAVFLVCPYRVEYYLEFQMEITLAMPLALLGWHRYLGRGSTRGLLLCLGALLFTFYSTLYYGIILSLALAAFTGAWLLLRPSARALRRLPGALAGGAGLGVLLVPLAIPYLRTKRELGFERLLAEQPAMHFADVLTYLETRHGWMADLTPETSAETALFMGLVPSLLVLAAVVVHAVRFPGRRRPLVVALGGTAVLGAGLIWIYATTDAAAAASRTGDWVFAALLAVAVLAAAIGVGMTGRALQRPVEKPLSRGEWLAASLLVGLVFVILSFGPAVRLSGWPLGDGLYPILYAALPFLHAVRVLTRFGVIWVLMASLVAAIGVAALLERVPRRWRRGVAVGLGVLVLLDLYPGTLKYERVSWPPADAVHEHIRRDPDTVAVLEVPLSDQPHQVYAMFRSLWHGKYVVNGFSGFVPEFNRLLAQRLRSWPGDHGQQLGTELRTIYPLRYLVVDRDELTQEAAALWGREAERYVDGITPVLTDGRWSLYRLQRQPEEATRIVRRFSFEHLRLHPRVRLRASVTGADRPIAFAEVRAELNGRVVTTLSLETEPGEFAIELPGPGRRAEANELVLRPDGYRPAARSAVGDTGTSIAADLRVLAGSHRDRAPARIWLNGDFYELPGRGYHVIVLSSDGDEVTDMQRFPTHARPVASRSLRRFVRALPAGTPVIAVTVGDVTSRLRDPAIQGLRRLGSEIDLRDLGHGSHALVGVKGARTGEALETAGARPAELKLGNEPIDSELRIRLEEFEMVSMPPS